MQSGLLLCVLVDIAGQGFIMYTVFIHMGGVPTDVPNAFIGNISNFVFSRLTVIEAIYSRRQGFSVHAAGSPPIVVHIDIERIMTPVTPRPPGPLIILPLEQSYSFIGNAFTVLYMQLSSFASVTSRPNDLSFRLRVRFQTAEPNALLLLINHTTQYLTLELIDGMLRMRASLLGFEGSRPGQLAMRSFDFQRLKFNNYMPHAIDIDVRAGNFTIILYNVTGEMSFTEPPIVFREKFATTKDEMAPFKSGDFFFGGLRSSEEFSAYASQFGLGSKRNFIGCLYNIEINGFILDRNSIRRFSPLFTVIDTCPGCTLTVNVELYIS